MKSDINKYKGIHPGKIISRELKRLGISQREFAKQIGEHSQSLNAVITGRRALTTELSVKIDRALGFEEGFLLALQAYYSAIEYKNKMASESIIGTPYIRRILFWDTNFDKLDWGRYRDAVIQRVLERGSEEEKDEIARFYQISRQEMEKYRPTNAYRIHLHEKSPKG